jgi:hypothetical protein
MERIADFFSRSGSYAEGRAHGQKILVARGQLAAILQVSQRVLGPDHPRTRSIQADLAAWAGATANTHP